MNLFVRKSDRLIDKCRRGDQAAMYRLYSQYVTSAFNTCLRLVGQKQEAEEIVQDAFTAAFANMGRLRDEDAFGGWLRRIVINKSLNHIRRRPGFVTGWSEPPDNLPMETTEDDWSSITPDQVAQAIKSLPEKARIVFSLYQIEGYRHRDIAGQMQISESTSKSQYTRAVMLLRERLTASAADVLNEMPLK